MKSLDKHLLQIEVWNLKRQGLNSLQVAEELQQPLRFVNKLYASTPVQITPNRVRFDWLKKKEMLNKQEARSV